MNTLNTQVIEESAAPPLVVPRRRWTVSDYHRMGEVGILTEDDRIELIEGGVIDMPPIGSQHADRVDQIAELLILRSSGKYRIRVQNPVRIGDYSEPEPDIAVVRRGSYADEHPVPADVRLLIEVADTTLTYDREVKIPLYARAGIPEVWLLDLQKRWVTVYREPSADGYRQMRRPLSSETLSPQQAPELVVRIDELF